MIFQKDPIQVKILEEKLRISEANTNTLRKEYEETINQKNERIQELEVENELLKKKLNSLPNLKGKILSKLYNLESREKSYKRKRQNSDYIVSSNISYFIL